MTEGQWFFIGLVAYLLVGAVVGRILYGLFLKEIKEGKSWEVEDRDHKAVVLSMSCILFWPFFVLFLIVFYGQDPEN